MNPAHNLSLPNRLNLWLPMMGVAVLGGVLVVIIFAVLAFEVLHLDRVYPGVTIAGIDVSSKTHSQVTEAIAGLSHEKLRRPLTSTWGITSGPLPARNWACRLMWRTPWLPHLSRVAREICFGIL
jgi:hypothetical protein